MVPLRRSDLGLLLATLLLATPAPGCGREAPGGPAPELRTSTGPSWTARAAASAGQGPTFVLVLDPRRWSALRPHLDALLPLLPPAPRDASGDGADEHPRGWPADLASSLRDAADPSAWLRVALDALGAPPPPDALDAWDRERPLVLALAEPPRDVPVGAIAPGYAPDALPGLRHQILVPARDPAALLRAFSSAWATRGAVRPPRPGDPPGAELRDLPDGAAIALVPEPDLLRLIIVSGGIAGGSDAPRPALIATPDAPAPTASLATLGEDPASLLVRPHKLAALSGWQSARDRVMAVRDSGPDQRAAAARVTLGIAVGCELLRGNEAPEVDDYAFSLADEDGALHVRMIASLTPRGAKAFAAGERPGEGLLSLRAADAPAYGWFRFDRVAATAALDGGITSPLEADDLAHSVETCGTNPLLPSATAPLGAQRRFSASVFGGLAPLAGGPRIPVGQIVLTRIGADAIIGGASLLTSDPSPFQAGLGLLLGENVTLEVAAEGDLQRVSLASGAAVKDLFGALDPEAPPLRLHLDLAALAPRLTPFAPWLAPLLQRYPVLDLRGERSGRALVADLVLARASGASPRPPDLRAHDWASPAAAGDPACSQRYAAELAPLLAVADASELLLEDVAPKLAALDATSACLKDHPNLAASYPELRRVGPLLLADAFAATWRGDDAVRLLAPLCAAGDGPTCARQAELRAAVLPRLPAPPRVACRAGDAFAAHRLALSPAGIALDGAPLRGPDELRAAVKELRLGPGDALGVGVDASMTLAALRPALAALSDAPEVPLALMLRDPDSPAFRFIPLGGLDLAASAGGRPPPADPGAQLLRVGDAPTPPGEPVARLHVAAAETSTWGDIAGALARSCQDARLVEAPRDGAPPRGQAPPRGVDPLSDRAAPADRAADPLGERPQPSPGAGEGLDADTIRRIVRAHVMEVRLCYEQALTRDPNAGGKIDVTFTIGEKGRVTAARAASDEAANKELGDCIAAAVRRWVFPRPGVEQTVTYPFVLSAG